jgi:uncharacterized protein (TIGR02186 family)
MRTLLAILTLLGVLLCAPVRAEDLVSGISQDVIEITSNYTGSDIVVFGAIERPVDAGTRDVVVVVRGPDTDVTVRKKARVGGLWINSDQAILKGMPSYYFIASTRPVAQIASNYTLKNFGLGLANLEPSSYHSHHDVEPFRAALVRRMQRDGLFTETSTSVEFLSETLFRVRVPVPASVPRGKYDVDVYLFRNGNAVSAQTTPLFVDQTGLERRLFNFAHAEPFIYGVSTVLLAALLGWISSLLFRQNL